MQCKLYSVKKICHGGKKKADSSPPCVNCRVELTGGQNYRVLTACESVVCVWYSLSSYLTFLNYVSLLQSYTLGRVQPTFLDNKSSACYAVIEFYHHLVCANELFITPISTFVAVLL